MRAARHIWIISTVIVVLLTMVVLGSALVGVSAQTQIAPTLTPPGLPGKIAFTSKRDGHDQVYLMNPDGSGQTNVSQNNYNDSQPAWSPDGSQIAFASQREGNNEICIMNADGSNQKCLTHQPTPGKKANPKLPQDYGPTWSPDSLHIAFVSTRTGNTDIWAVNIDGTNPTNLTQSSSNNDHPAWSPDLKSIAFNSDRDGNTEICVMDASGFNQRCLTNERTANRKPDRNKAADSYPAWSPDSQKIAFVSTREKNRNKQIFVMNADGSNPINVTQKISADDHPTWSPDGTLLAFMSNRDGLINDLYITNLDGSNQTRTTQTDKGGDFFPVWVPDGSHLTGTPTETLTPTPTGTIHFTPFPTDTPLPGGGGQYIPIKTNTPVPPLTATLYFPPPGPPPCNVTRYTVTNEADYADNSDVGSPISGSLRYVVNLATTDVANAIYANQTGSKVPVPLPVVTFCPNVKSIVLFAANDPIHIPDSITIQGNDPQLPVISGGGYTDIFFIEDLFGGAPDTAVTMNNIAIVSGKPSGNTQYRGGAITLSTKEISESAGAPSLNLNNVTLQNNSNELVVPVAGAIYLDDSALLTTTNTNIANNTGAIAGAVYVERNATFTANSNTVIQNNQAVTQGNFSGLGGGVFVATGGTLVATNSTFTGNTASDSGGGIYGAGSCGNGATITLNTSTVSNNTATNHGGGIYNTGTLTLNGTSSNPVNIVYNKTTDVSSSGGGIYNDGIVNGTFVNFNGNTSNGLGGAIADQYETGCTLSVSFAKINPAAAPHAASQKGVTISNSIFSNNTAAGNGGAIYSNGPLTIQNSVITNNTAQNGGGVYIAGGSYTVDSQSKISGNHASGGNPDSYVASSVKTTNATPTSTATSTATATSTSTATNTATSTSTSTATATATYTATPQPTATHTSTPTATNSPLPSATHTPPPSVTHTPPPSATHTPSATATNTPTDTPKNS